MKILNFILLLVLMLLASSCDEPTGEEITGTVYEVRFVGGAKVVKGGRPAAAGLGMWMVGGPVLGAMAALGEESKGDDRVVPTINMCTLFLETEGGQIQTFQFKERCCGQKDSRYACASLMKGDKVTLYEYQDRDFPKYWVVGVPRI